MEDAERFLADYSFNQTHIDNFIEEWCEVGKEYRIHTKKLYQHYLDYCELNIVRPISQSPAEGRRIVERIYGNYLKKDVSKIPKCNTVGKKSPAGKTKKQLKSKKTTEHRNARGHPGSVETGGKYVKIRIVTYR